MDHPRSIPSSQEKAMGVLTGAGYCPYCREEVMMACAATSDLLHLTLTLLTGGLWGIVWLHRRRHARVCLCCQCGRSLPRSRLKTLAGAAGEAPWLQEAMTRNGSEFNSLLVARNLVYYVPTSARFRRTSAIPHFNHS
jgi:hypothetical protein